MAILTQEPARSAEGLYSASQSQPCLNHSTGEEKTQQEGRIMVLGRVWLWTSVRLYAPLRLSGHPQLRNRGWLAAVAD